MCQIYIEITTGSAEQLEKYIGGKIMPPRLGFIWNVWVPVSSTSTVWSKRLVSGSLCFWLTPLRKGRRRSILIGLLYIGLSYQEPGSQELKYHGPHSLISSTWEFSSSLFQHLKPAAWLRFKLHPWLPSWVRFCCSWTVALQLSQTEFSSCV